MQQDPREITLARRWTALVNNIVSTNAMTEDFRLAINDVFTIINEKDAQIKKLQEDSERRIKELEKALDEASKLAKIDKVEMTKK